MGLLAALLPPEAWVVLSAGEGSQGARLYEWAWLHFRRARGEPGMDVVVANPTKSSRSQQASVLPSLGTHPDPTHDVGASGRLTLDGGRGYEQAKGEVGLDQYEVRSWTAWYRFITLALLAHAFLVVMRLQAQAAEQKRGPMNEYYER